MPKPKDSLYRGRRKFDREQLVFAAECILIGALDRIDCGLPHNNITADERSAFVDDVTKLSPYEYGGLECAGMALGVLYAQLTDDGLGVYDSLVCADKFHEACERLVKRAWRNNGKTIANRCKRLMKGGNSTTIQEIYGSDYPDTRHHAEKFVDEVFGDYLSSKAA